SVDLNTHYEYTGTQIQIDDNLSYAKSTMNHKDVMYAAEDGSGSGCEPVTDSCNFNDIDGANSLRYRAYYPKKTIHDYNSKRLPVIVLFHGGGFQECTDYKQIIMKTLCEEFSGKGFIAFTVEYRRARVTDTINTLFVSVQEQLALYRAQQDGRGFIRSIMKKQIEDLENDTWDYIFDTDQFFIGGVSSGGVIAMGCAYYRTPGLTTQTMVNSVFPKGTGTLDIWDSTVLGPVHADYYYGEVDEAYWPNIAGVLNLWGGLPIPKSYDDDEASFFSVADDHANPPLIAFHGYLDDTVDFKDNAKQDVKFSKLPMTGDPGYNSESFCLNSTVSYTVAAFHNPTPGPLVKRCSSLNMYKTLKELNRYAELYYDCQADHGLGTTCDYGIGNTNNTVVTKYIVQRAANFFQVIMNNTAPVAFGITERSVFRDCQNFRNLGSTVTDASGCTDLPDDAYKKCIELEE
ncbi:MAG TPA: hypothetical protein PLA68_10920, partial [Panacibacter sp.]|nr:hypothetical protein [Panacibacter sp.]